MSQMGQSLPIQSGWACPDWPAADERRSPDPLAAGALGLSEYRASEARRHAWVLAFHNDTSEAERKLLRIWHICRSEGGQGNTEEPNSLCNRELRPE
jgi:hypothetical protein